MLYPPGPGVGGVVFEELPGVDDIEAAVLVLETMAWELEGDIGGLDVLGPVKEENDSEPAGPSIVPGPSSGLTIISKTSVRMGATGEER